MQAQQQQMQQHMQAQQQQQQQGGYQPGQGQGPPQVLQVHGSRPGSVPHHPHHPHHHHLRGPPPRSESATALGPSAGLGVGAYPARPGTPGAYSAAAYPTGSPVPRFPSSTTSQSGLSGGGAQSAQQQAQQQMEAIEQRVLSRLLSLASTGNLPPGAGPPMDPSAAAAAATGIPFHNSGRPSLMGIEGGGWGGGLPPTLAEEGPPQQGEVGGMEHLGGGGAAVGGQAGMRELLESIGLGVLWARFEAEDISLVG